MTKTLEYALCPKCWRAVPKQTGEQFCPNDGTPLLSACPHCQAPITSPYARYCTRCGQALFKQIHQEEK